MNDTPMRLPKPGRRPLYDQVRDTLRERIETGAWPAGYSLPSEFALAGELSVSQGTVRKALDDLAREKLITRRQGLGTFVAEQTPEDVMFRFFKIFDAKGGQVFPDSCNVKLRHGVASRKEAVSLRIDARTPVVRISRTRVADGIPFLRETIVLPAALYPGIGDGDEAVPNTLYDYFQRRYGITVVRADERIDAVAADVMTARALGIPKHSPVLRIDRVTFGLNERPIEQRVSLCHLNRMHYFAQIA